MAMLTPIPNFLQGNTISRDGASVIPVTSDQMACLESGVEWTRNLELPLLHDASDPNSRMFVVVTGPYGDEWQLVPTRMTVAPTYGYDVEWLKAA